MIRRSPRRLSRDGRSACALVQLRSAPGDIRRKIAPPSLPPAASDQPLARNVLGIVGMKAMFPYIAGFAALSCGIAVGCSYPSIEGDPLDVSPLTQAKDSGSRDEG